MHVQIYTSEAHGQMLENYVKTIFQGKVWIMRSPEPLGLIRGRAWGIQASSAPVIVVLDAHMEMREKWLEALVYEIHKDRKIMASVYNDYMKPQEDGKLG